MGRFPLLPARRGTNFGLTIASRSIPCNGTLLLERGIGPDRQPKAPKGSPAKEQIHEQGHRSCGGRLDRDHFSPASAAPVVVAVNGNDNPFLSGDPNGFACCGGDSAPAQSPTLALSGFDTSQAITFSAIGEFSNMGGPRP